MTPVHIHSQSWIAKLAAKKLGFPRIAIVIGNRIHLHNATTDVFINTQRWVLHELKHVEQYEQHGYLGFIAAYLAEYAKNGYYENRFEVEARAAEADTTLLEKYHLLIQK